MINKEKFEVYQGWNIEQINRQITCNKIMIHRLQDDYDKSKDKRLAEKIKELKSENEVLRQIKEEKILWTGEY